MKNWQWNIVWFMSGMATGCVIANMLQEYIIHQIK